MLRSTDIFEIEDKKDDENVYAEVGKRIRELRVNKNMSQADLANEIGISGSYLSHIESGRRNPDLTILVSIVKVLGYGLDYLVFGFDSDGEHVNESVNDTLIKEVSEILSKPGSKGFRRVLNVMIKNYEDL